LQLSTGTPTMNKLLHETLDPLKDVYMPLVAVSLSYNSTEQFVSEMAFGPKNTTSWAFSFSAALKKH